MSAYITSILGVVLISSLLFSILPSGKTSGIVKGMAHLACVLVIISPVLRFFQKTNEEIGSDFVETFFHSSVISTDEAFIKYYSEMTLRQVEKKMEEELLEKYDVEAEISLKTSNEKFEEEEKIKILEIVVKVKSEEKKDTLEEIRKYFTKQYCNEVRFE